VSDFKWDPEGYLSLLSSDVPAYPELQERTADATGSGAARVLELGVGTGETARRVLARHPGAEYVAVDSSPEMLAFARERLPGADLRLGRLEDPLPDGPFDLVASALCVHHLTQDEKRDLFARVHRTLIPGGRFVLGDVVVPEDPADASVPLSPDFDRPDTLQDQVTWLRQAGFDTHVAWARNDLAVVVATRP
jgi:tRNA (cmo5U34)-methyltransferase